MEASSSGAGKRIAGRATAINSVTDDLLRSIFSLLGPLQLVWCSLVCKSWHSTITASSLVADLYSRAHPRDTGSEAPSMREFLQGMGMMEHASAFLARSGEVHRWRAHNVRIKLCRMRRGLILTGAEDKVMRLWSADSYKCLDEYAIPNIKPLIDYDFDESKIVGLSNARICILRRNRRSVFQSQKGVFTGLCMRYVDPEAVIGCEDGTAHVFDMYSGRCSQVIRMRAGPIQCLALTEEQVIFGGSTFGTVAVADFSTGDRIASLASTFRPTGIKSLHIDRNSHLLFAGSTSGHAHCWDLRTLKPLWETRVSPNVIYSTHHLSGDASTLAVGGIDGILRILSQSTGEVLSSFVMDMGPPVSSNGKQSKVEKKASRKVSDDTCIDKIPRSVRPSITCLAVGLKKVVTVHNDERLSVWKFP